MATKKIL